MVEGWADELYRGGPANPMTDAEVRLAEWRAQGHACQLFDARAMAEYAKMRVPGAECLPNGELAHRIATVDAAATQPVAITCAGRTCGITGVIGMIAAGHQGEVCALRGLMGRVTQASHVLRLANDAGIAALVADDLRTVGARQVCLIDAGLGAMANAGAVMESSPGRPEDEIVHLYVLHDRHDRNLNASRRYLAWETGLNWQL